MFALGWVCLLVAVAMPMMLTSLNRSRGLSAARYLASRMSLARAYAISRSANVALRFETGTDGIRFSTFIDGNGDGVRSADILARLDPLVEPPVALFDLFPGVAIAMGPDSEGAADRASRLISFSPDGTATAGTVYITSRDGTRWAVRVLGTTARTRVLRYSSSSDAWVPAF